MTYLNPQLIATNPTLFNAEIDEICSNIERIVERAKESIERHSNTRDAVAKVTP